MFLECFKAISICSVSEINRQMLPRGGALLNRATFRQGSSQGESSDAGEAADVWTTNSETTGKLKGTSAKVKVPFPEYTVLNCLQILREALVSISYLRLF